MKYPVFLLLLWAMGLFYRWEHRLFIRELSMLAPGLKEKGAQALAGKDWRIVRVEAEGVYALRRAFQIKTRADALRYGLPLLFFCIILFVLKDWIFALGYAGLVALKWFICEAVVHTAGAFRYDVRIFGRRLFGEGLA